MASGGLEDAGEPWLRQSELSLTKPRFSLKLLSLFFFFFPFCLAAWLVGS